MAKEIKIVKDGDPVLRVESSPVPVAEIRSAKIQKVIKDMEQALAQESRFGVAIAAPQIGVPLQIFVVSHTAVERRGQAVGEEQNLVCVNPVIKKRSRQKQESYESCLSIQGRPTGPDVAGIVERPDKLTIEYYDRDGTKKNRGASGLLAAIFDHEIDHLHGTLFIDKSIDLWEIDKDFNRIE